MRSNMAASYFYRSHFLMFSRFELFIPCNESMELENLFQEMVEKIMQLENQISRYIEESETSRINKNASINPVKVSNWFLKLMAQCMEYNRETGGYFNICAGSGLQKDSLGFTLDEKLQTVCFHSAAISVDFGAIGKGMAMEIALNLLHKAGIQQAFINFGDSSVFGLGAHPHGDCWPVNITNGEKSLTLKLYDNGLSSSGLHPVNGEFAAHIFDPLTNQLLKRSEKVVVTNRSPVLAEVLSTAFYAAPQHKRDEISCNFPGAEIYIL